MFYKKDVFRSLKKFTGKHLCQCLLRPATLLKKRLCHRCFPVNFAKFLRTPFLQNTSGRVLQRRQRWEAGHNTLRQSAKDREEIMKQKLHEQISIIVIISIFYIFRRSIIFSNREMKKYSNRKQLKKSSISVDKISKKPCSTMISCFLLFLVLLVCPPIRGFLFPLHWMVAEYFLSLLKMIEMNILETSFVPRVICLWFILREGESERGRKPWERG